MDDLILVPLLVMYLFEAYIWLKCMSTMKRKYENKIFYWAAGLLMFIVFSVKQYLIFNDVGGNITSSLATLAAFLLYFVLTMALFEEKFTKKVIYYIMYLILQFVSEMVVLGIAIFILDIPMIQLSEYGLLNLLMTILSKLLFLTLCYFTYFNGVHNLIRKIYDKKEVIPLVLGSCLCEIPLVSYFNNNVVTRDNIKTMYLIGLADVYLILVIIYIVYVMSKQNDKISDMEQQLSQSRQIIDLTKKLRGLKHDMSFHASVLKNLAYKGDNDELLRYIESTFSDLTVAEDVFTLPDKSLSMALSVLAKMAREKDIRFDHIITVSDFEIPTNDICSLLANIIKNAIEATEQLEKEKRYICLEIASRDGGYYIRCVNPYKKRPDFHHGKLITSKKDFENHGFGVGIIKSITDKYKGITEILLHDTCFEVYCFIPSMK